MDNEVKALLVLLKMEVDCLRSVLSEYEGHKYECTQMVNADNIRSVIDILECKYGL